MTGRSPSQTERLVSVDAFRGFAMFLILAYDIGGAPVLQTFTKLFGEKFSDSVAYQFNYNFVEGLRFSFIAMPMFLFIVGLVIPVSVKKRLAAGSKPDIYRHILKRSLILFVLGLIAGGHLLDLNLSDIPVYNNVLEYIGIGYLFCCLIVLNTGLVAQIALTVGLLLIYWILFLVVRVPGWEGGIYSGEMNLAIYVDDVVLGRFHHHGSWEVLATVSFVANMLLGVLTGHLLYGGRAKKTTVRLLFLYGGLMSIAGIVWGQVFPVIRSLWTSSFVLLTCGISTLVLALFYLITEVWGYSKWAFFFVVFGVNSIAIYMMAHLFDFSLIGNIFVGGLSSLFGPAPGEFIRACGAMTVMWLIMYWLYRKRTFIRI